MSLLPLLSTGRPEAFSGSDQVKLRCDDIFQRKQHLLVFITQVYSLYVYLTTTTVLDSLPWLILDKEIVEAAH
jgi:hypothetical protein